MKNGKNLSTSWHKIAALLRLEKWIAETKEIENNQSKVQKREGDNKRCNLEYERGELNVNYETLKAM